MFKRIFRKSILVTFLFILSIPIFCEESIKSEITKITVDDAVNLALKNNISIERNEITLNALKRADSHSWNSVSPSFSLGASSDIPIDALSDNDSIYSARFGISATLSVSLSANLYTSIQSAKLNYEIGKITFDDAVKNVELSVRQSFNGLLYERDYIKLQEKNLEIARSQYNTNLSKYNSGRLSEIDVLSAEVNYKEKIPTVESAKTTYLNDLDSFKQLIGINLDENIELSGNLEDNIVLDDININGIEMKSSMIRTLEKRIESAKNSVMDKRFSAYSPTLSARVNFQDQSLYAGYDDRKGGTAPDPVKSTSLTLSASIPLDGVLPWSQKNDNIDSAKDTLKDYELQLENAKTSFKISVDSLLRSIKRSQSSIKSRQANVKLAQRSYNMTLEAYNRGTKDFLALQNASSALLSAQISLQGEIRTLLNSILSLENALGIEFGSLNLISN